MGVDGLRWEKEVETEVSRADDSRRSFTVVPEYSWLPSVPDSVAAGERFLGNQSFQAPLRVIKGIRRARHRLNGQRASWGVGNSVAGVHHDSGERAVHHNVDDAPASRMTQRRRGHSFRIAFELHIAVIKPATVDRAIVTIIPVGARRGDDSAGRHEPFIEL